MWIYIFFSPSELETEKNTTNRELLQVMYKIYRNVVLLTSEKNTAKDINSR